MFDTAAAIDAYVDSLHEERAPDGYWHPSSISGCLRQAVYEYRGTAKTNPRDPRSQRVLRVGHVFHDFVQTAIEKTGLVDVFYREVKFTHEGLRLKGSVDGLVQYSSGEWEVLEFKTINSNAFRYATRDPDSMPKPAHVIQVTAYLKALRECGGIDADGNVVPPLGDRLTQARVAYVSKDDLRVEEYDVLWSPVLEADLLSRLAIVESAGHNGPLPDRLPLVSDKKTGKPTRSWECGYCPFQDHCWYEGGLTEW